MTRDGRPQSSYEYPSTHRIRGCHITRPNSARITELSLPKDSKRIWSTSYGKPLTWGNQETIWPLNKATQTYTASDRLKRLATPKTNHRPSNTTISQYEYSCGRESMLWIVSPAALRAVSSARTQSLAKHKTVPEDYVPYTSLGWGRPSTIWRPSSAAIQSKLRPRTAQLAIPKQLHIDYLSPRSVYTVVSDATKEYEASPRINSLAIPKTKNEGLYRDTQWPVSQAALKAEASQRLSEIARPKRLPDGYEPNRDVAWKVTTGAKSAIASARLLELAKPIIRESMDHLQFNPEAFIVSEAAKKYKASQRIEELSQPIQRM